MGVQERVDIVVNADTYAGKKLLEDMQRAFERIGQSGGQAGDKVSSGWGKAASDIGKFALGMAGAASITQVLSTAVGRLRMEYENFLQRADRAASMQTDFASAQRRMAGALNMQEMPLGIATNRIMQISRATGVNPSALAIAAESALSGKGPAISDSAAFSAVEQAAKYRPGPRTDDQTLSGIAQGILTIQKSQGVTSEEAMGFIRNTLRTARNTDIDSFVTYTLPAIIKSRAFGGEKDDLSYLASLEIGMGQRAEDPSGRRTATGFINLLKQIKIATSPHVGTQASVKEQMDFLFNSAEGEKIRQRFLGPLFNGQVDAGSLAQSGVAQQIADKLMGEEAKITLRSEAATFVPFVEFLQGGDNNTRKLINAARQGIPGITSAENLRLFREGEAAISGSPFQQTAGIEKAFAGTQAGLLLPNTYLGARGQLRKSLPDLLQSAGVSKLTSDAVMTAFDAKSALAADRSGVIDAATSALQAGISPETSRVGWAAGGAGGSVEVQNVLTQEQKETNALLRDLIATLGKQKITIESGGEEQRGRIDAERAGR